MKKIGLVLLAGIIGLNATNAKAENTFTLLKEYGLPCALAMGASAALVKNDGVAIGGAICLGVASATYLNRKVVDSDELKNVVDVSVAERDAKINSEVSAKLAQMQINQKAKDDEYREVMRQILSEKLQTMQEDMKAMLESKFKEGDVMPALEKRIDAKIKEQVILEGRARSREVINDCVDEVIRQVTVKPIAAPAESQAQ